MPEKIHSRARTSLVRFAVPGVAAVALIGAYFLYAQRFDHPVLCYYGASPEVPEGTAIAILNPLRERKDEANAEWLIRDLRTDKCEQVVRERLFSDPTRVCPVLRRNTKARLIWLDAERKNGLWARSRNLYYDLPESKSRLVVSFGNSEAGWGVSTAALIR